MLSKYLSSTLGDKVQEFFKIKILF